MDDLRVFILRHMPGARDGMEFSSRQDGEYFSADFKGKGLVFFTPEELRRDAAIAELPV